MEEEILENEKEDFIQEVKPEILNKIECIKCKFYYEKYDIEENGNCFICNQSRTLSNRR